MRYIIALLALFLVGCGSKREDVKHEEREDKTVTRTTTIAETTRPTPTGPALVETTKTTVYSEQVAKGTTDAQINSTTTLQAPEIAAAVSTAANIVAPGFGGLVSGALGWLTGTPEGAGTGLCLGTLVAGLTKRAISKEKELTKTKRHFKAVVKGNSDFMQAHPDQAEKLKAAQRSAQADPELKANVVAARVAEGQV